MKRQLSTAVAVCLFGLTAAQADWERYVPRRIADVIDVNAPGMSEPVRFFFSASDFATRARVVSIGDERPIPAERRDFIARYGTMLGRPELATLFEHEALFQEGEVRHWIAIQKPVLEFFRREVPAGRLVDLYLTWAGALQLPDDVPRDWIFLINEFAVVRVVPDAKDAIVVPPPPPPPAPQ